MFYPISRKSLPFIYSWASFSMSLRVDRAASPSMQVSSTSVSSSLLQGDLHLWNLFGGASKVVFQKLKFFISLENLVLALWYGLLYYGLDRAVNFVSFCTMLFLMWVHFHNKRKKSAKIHIVKKNTLTKNLKI